MNQFAKQIEIDGYAIVENLLPRDFVERAKGDLEAAIQAEVEYHGGTDYPDYGMVMLCSLYGKSFIELFDLAPLMACFNAVLGPGCITYAYTSSSMPPGGSNYSNRIHVDCPRLIPGYTTNFGAAMMLDDFTLDNGATWFLPGSHTLATPPDENTFYAQARRAVAPAGSVFFLNARLWHAGAVNTTDRFRHALTINMCRPWMKQRLDIPRAMSHLDTSKFSETALQKLGFYSQVPASYEEYYVPLEERKFRQKVE